MLNMKLKNKLFIFAQTIPDFRLNRKKLHPSENIVFITILAVICGAETWEEIEDYGIVKREFLETILDLENGIPSHDTFNRFFSLLKPSFSKNISCLGLNQYLTITRVSWQLTAKQFEVLSNLD